MSLFGGLKADTDFFLVRHGESAGNKEGRIQGHTDLPLTDKGRDHAAATGRWFASHRLDYICSSPLERARETAEGIRRESGADLAAPELLDGLRELDTGVFSNRTFDELKREMPDVYQDFQARSWEAVPGAESIAALEARALSHWRHLVGVANGGKRQLVTVTHYGFVQWLFKTTFSRGNTSWMPLVSVGNCAVFHLHVSPRTHGGHTSYFQEWRLVDHLAWISQELPGGQAPSKQTAP